MRIMDPYGFPLILAGDLNEGCEGPGTPSSVRPNFLGFDHAESRLGVLSAILCVSPTESKEKKKRRRHSN